MSQYCAAKCDTFKSRKPRPIAVNRLSVIRDPIRIVTVELFSGIIPSLCGLGERGILLKGDAKRRCACICLFLVWDGGGSDACRAAKTASLLEGLGMRWGTAHLAASPGVQVFVAISETALARLVIFTV